jgi:hypothetical protein
MNKENDVVLNSHDSKHNNPSRNTTPISLGVTLWKCYRCSLFFKNESSAVIHEDISKHHIQKISF